MTVLIDNGNESEVQNICRRRKNKPDELLEILHDIQANTGWISQGAISAVANALNRSRAEVHGVATFYHDYKLQEPARHCIKLCRAEACQAVGSEALATHAMKTLKGAPEGVVDIEAIYCLGNCALGPAAMVDGELYAKLTPEKLDALISKLSGAE